MGKIVFVVGSLLSSLGLLTGFLLIANVLGLMELPEPIQFTEDGNRLDKWVWGAEFLGIPVTNLKLLLGTCKIAGLIGIWTSFRKLALLMIALLYVCVYVVHLKFEKTNVPLILAGIAIANLFFNSPSPSSQKKKSN